MSSQNFLNLEPDCIWLWCSKHRCHPLQEDSWLSHVVCALEISVLWSPQGLASCHWKGDQDEMFHVEIMLGNMAGYWRKIKLGFLYGGRKLGLEKSFLKIVKTKEISGFPLRFLEHQSPRMQSILMSPDWQGTGRRTRVEGGQLEEPG